MSIPIHISSMSNVQGANAKNLWGLNNNTLEDKRIGFTYDVGHFILIPKVWLFENKNYSLRGRYTKYATDGNIDDPTIIPISPRLG